MEDGLDGMEDGLDGTEAVDDSKRTDEKKCSDAGQAEPDCDDMTVLDDNTAEKEDGNDEMADGNKIG